MWHKAGFSFFRVAWLTVMLAAASVATAADIDGRAKFDITSQPLDSALLAYSDQANLQVISSATELSGIVGRRVSGTFTRREALQMLLEGTQLTFESTAQDTVTIRASDASEAKRRGAQSTSAPAAERPVAPAGAERSQKSDESPQGRIYGLEEVTVTARKRVESLQDVPISVTALTSADLHGSHVNKVRDLEFILPNFSAPGGDMDSFVNLSIRGVQTRPRNIGFDSGVGFFVDGYYTGRQASFNRDLADVERIEVLYGPQGSLFGKNTTLGAFNVVTRKPGKNFEGFVTLEAGNYDLMRAKAAVSGPLVDDHLYAKATFSGAQRDGYITNLYNGDDVSTVDSAAGRVDFRGQWGGFTADLALDVLESDTDVAFTTLVNGLYATGPYEINYDLPSWEQTDSWGAALTLSWELASGGTLTSMTSFRDQGYEFAFDTDETPILIFHLDPWLDDERLVTQELRLESPTGTALEYVVGAYYLTQDLSSYRDLTLGPLFGGGRGYDESTVDVESIAIFGELNYDLTQRLTLNLGMRYTVEDKETRFTQDGAGVFGDFPYFEGKRSDEALSPTAGLQFQLDEDAMVYLRFARGFKSGGFNVDIISSLESIEFDEEVAENFEVGLKAELFDRRLRLNTAAFYTRYTDLQVAQFVGGVGSVISNAAKATAAGFEGTGSWLATDALKLSASFGYADATFDSYPNATPLGDDYSGHTLSGPKWTMAAAAEYGLQFADIGDLRLRTEYTYRDEIYHDPANAFENLTDAFGLLNVRAQFEAAGGKWIAALWAQNVLDEVYSTIAFPGTGPAEYGTKLEHFGPPRMYGLEVTYRF